MLTGVFAEPDRFSCPRPGCTAKFGQYNHLRKHEKIMHPPTCETCGRVFKEPATLRHHMNIHVRAVRGRVAVLLPALEHGM